MTSFFRISVALSVIFLAAACSHQPAVPGMKIGKPYTIDGQAYFPAYEPGYDKVGDASWYGPGFHGKYTANGEVFNQDDMTAAHPTLPMPSIVRVTNLANGKSTMVRINDRGPFKSNRIIDLSKASAMSIGLLSTGKVRVQYLPQETNDYLSQFKDNNNQPLTMEAFVEHKAEHALPEQQIVQSTVENTQLGQTVNEAAPIQSVSSENLEGSLQGQDVPSLTKGQADEEQDEANDVPEPAPKPTKVKQEAYNPPPVAKTQASVMNGEKGKAVHLQGATDHDADYIAAPASKAPRPAKVADLAEAPAKPVAALTPSAQPAMRASTGSGIFIQVGSFASEANARKLDAKLSAIGTVDITKTDASGKEWWRVRVGPFSNSTDAAAALDKVHEAGLADARIVH